MTQPDPDPRAAYAARTAALVDDFRAHGGKVTSGPFVDRELLLLTTIGARTGQLRLAPLVYDRDGDRLVVVGSKQGAPTHPAWYLNLLANPIVTVEVGAERFQARAVVAQDGERDRLFAARVERYPVFAEYQQQTERIIPVVLLERIP